MPPITPHITEHRIHTVTCPQCAAQVRASLPSEVQAGYGPHLTTIASLLHGRYRLSMRETSEVLGDLFGIPMSPGSVVASCQRVSAALAPVSAQGEDLLPQQPVVNVDETSWREGTTRCWLWVVVAPIVTLFHLNRSRGGQVWRALLGESFGGILGSDRLPAYKRHPPERRQLCWAHLQRNLRAIADRRGAVGAWAREGLTWVQMLFAIWHAYDAETIDRTTMQLAMEPVQDAIWDCLLCGEAVPWPKAQV